MDERNIENSVTIFKALADVTRMRIMSTIIDTSKTVSEIVKETNESQSCVSHQLRVLKKVSIVKNQRKGKYVYYTLDDDHVKNILKLTFLHAQHTIGKNDEKEVRDK